MPTWRRAGLPLVYVGEELAAVADLWIAEGYEANDGVPGWRLQWHESDPPGMPEKCVFD